MKAIVGLGNPGSKYRGTRHNVGFAVLDELARRAGLTFGSAPVDAQIAKIRGAVASGGGAASGFSRMGPDDVLLAKPLTFMNASGEAVGGLLRYFKIELADLLVVVDDVQLALGRLRIRRAGSAGGHNGLKSVIEHIGSDFARLRVGVGRGDPKWDLADHVLSEFSPEERSAIEPAVARAADAVELFLTGGIEQTMNRFNAKGDQSVDEDNRQTT